MTEESWEDYRPEHREGLSSLVNDVHAEFGFAYDPVLDADLDDPSAHYLCILLVTRGNTVLGSAALTEPRAHTARITRMYLRPSIRGRGWGRRLLDALTDRAIAAGCAQIGLDTTTRQADARRLFESHGFTLVRQDGEALEYRKDL